MFCNSISDKWIEDRPAITLNENYFWTSGGVLQLNCTVKGKSVVNNLQSLNISWATPNANIAQRVRGTSLPKPFKLNLYHIVSCFSKQEKRATIHKFLERDSDFYPFRYKAISRLTITDFDEFKDFGFYSCNVGFESNYMTSVSFDVDKVAGRLIKFKFSQQILQLNCFVGGGEYAFLSTWKESLGYTYNFVHKKGSEVTWRVNVNGQPPPSIFWSDNDDLLIPWSSADDQNSKFVAKHEGRSTTLKISNLTCIDSGYFTLYADNWYKRQQQKYRLLVEGEGLTEMCLLLEKRIEHFSLWF